MNTYTVIAKRQKDGFEVVERKGEPHNLDLEPLAKILLDRLMRSCSCEDTKEPKVTNSTVSA